MPETLDTRANGIGHGELVRARLSDRKGESTLQNKSYIYIMFQIQGKYIREQVRFSRPCTDYYLTSKLGSQEISTMVPTNGSPISNVYVY